MTMKTLRVVCLSACLAWSATLHAENTPAFRHDRLNIFPAAAATAAGRTIAVDGDISEWKPEAFVTMARLPDTLEIYSVDERYFNPSNTRYYWMPHQGYSNWNEVGTGYLSIPGHFTQRLDWGPAILFNTPHRIADSESGPRLLLADAISHSTTLTSLMGLYTHGSGGGSVQEPGLPDGGNALYSDLHGSWSMIGEMGLFLMPDPGGDYGRHWVKFGSGDRVAGDSGVAWNSANAHYSYGAYRNVLLQNPSCFLGILSI